MLNREAKARRKRFHDLLSEGAKKRRRMEKEKSDIIKAMEETKAVQAEIAAEDKRMAEVAVARNKILAEMEEKRKLEMSKKRKSLHETPANDNAATPGPSYRNHKRSRTVGSGMLPPPRPAHSPPNDFKFSNTELHQKISRSRSARDFGRSINHSPSTDTTKTDFFRLLAAGVDPETPWIPLTTTQVIAKQKKDKEELDARIEAAYLRRRMGIPKKKSESPRPASESPAVAPASSPPAQSTPGSSSSTGEMTEDIIAQSREATRMMVEDTKWLHEINQQMKKDLDRRDAEQEALRSSTSSNQSGRLSINGLPMVNGYEYWPSPDQHGASMSRVERRIRETGARGFANRPFGKYKDRPAYTPVPMSKKTARKYAQAAEDVEEVEINGTAKKRKKHGEVDRSYKPSGDDELTEEEQELEYAGPKRPKAIKHAQPTPKVSVPSIEIAAKPPTTTNPFQRLQNTQADDEDEEELLEDDKDPQQSYSQQSYYENGEDGDTEELDEEEELLEDSDEEDYDEDYDESGQEPDRLRSTSRAYDDAPTPNTQTSHVSSGIGATAEDPFELSD